MVRVALRSPARTGEKTAVMLQLYDGGSVDPAQLSATFQSPAWSPPFETKPMCRSPVPTLLRVISWGAELCVICCVSVRLAGFKRTTGTGASTSSADATPSHVGPARARSKALMEPAPMEAELLTERRSSAVAHSGLSVGFL